MNYLLLLATFVAAVSAQDFSGKNNMNDIFWDEFKNFPEKWQLVTIRFRKDTGEMRLTYANDIAMKTLKQGRTDYEDGAVFGKTGIHTGADPQFESSLVPKGIRRYQLMIKDKKKYDTTGGWGYALFDKDGKTFPEDPKITQNACYACHSIVQNRGDVFSEVFDFVHDMKFPKTKKSAKQPFGYTWLAVPKLPGHIKQYMDKNVNKIRFFENEEMRSQVFQGTLDEIKPHLEDEAKEHRTPAIFMSKDTKRFVIVIPKKNPDCPELGSFEIVSTNLKNEPIVEKFCTHD
jgi:hypothetical protein